MKVFMLIGLLSFIPSSFAEMRTPPVSLQSPDHVKLSPASSPSDPSTGVMRIDVMVAKGFHVQANPASRDGLIATEIQIDPTPHFEFSSFKYPKGIQLKLTQGDTEVMTYSGAFQIAFTVSEDAPIAKKSLIHAHLRYQACDEKACLRPTTLPFDFWVVKQ